ncbi:multiple sugar transport system substrate-binding protein [Pullulanibacillus pueri]|uniref:Sugar ABC transporter substrate-binding protein n=1 Tax=Pullulanibacillus pueri TaxID=1437324 RepID=A0A8J2ZSS1_9BACL|nr:ABC transporter substrate-binding protein [Pullulanibacillus pueri]MBM7681846.1 multiple sugar transport system substrate-binding protein [Pullulanibacillus pueri]GGH76320.1 sugar ABC transporter substrate-binding protein [Pullulanibacillus pueri]
MKKKLISITVMIILIFALSACGSSKDSGGKDGKVTLTLLTHYSAQQEDELMKYIKMWNKENPNIQVKHKSVNFDNLLSTVMAQQTSGQSSDIVHVYSLWGGQLNQSHVLATPPKDVTDDIKSNYPDAAIKSSSVNGNLLGYPSEIETYALFYNKKLLKEAGYDSPPKTWDEMYEMSEKLTKKDSKGKIKQEGFGLLSGWDSAVVHPYLSLLYTNGGNFLSSNHKQAELNSPEAQQTFDYEMKFINSGITDRSFDAQKGFANEDVAMTINAGWWLGSLKTTMKDKFKDVAVAPIPSPDGNGQGSISYGYFYGVNNQSKHKEEAWKFLKWLNSKELDNGATGESQFLVSQGIIPTRNSDIKALSKELSDPNYKPFINALDFAKPEPNIFAGQKIKTDLQKQIEQVWSKQTSVKNGLNNANKVINQELK